MKSLETQLRGTDTAKNHHKIYITKGKVSNCHGYWLLLVLLSLKTLLKRRLAKKEADKLDIDI